MKEKITQECLYCAHFWEIKTHKYGWIEPLLKKCPKCQSSNIDTKKHELIDTYAVPKDTSEKIDYYAPTRKKS